MANALFGYNNLIDQPTTVLSCGSQRSNLPVANLADPDPQRPWVTAGTTKDWAHADFGGAQSVALLGLFGALLTSAARVRWRLSSQPLVEATPAVDFDLRNGLPAGATFTRASTATYFDAAGVLRTAPAGVPRIGYRYDATTGAWVAAGYLSEEARTNLLLYSEQFDLWSSSAGAVTPNARMAPDGTQSADLISATANYGGMLQSVAVAAGTAYTYSVHLERAAQDWAYMTIFDGATPALSVWFNLATGQVGTVVNSGSNYTSPVASIDPIGGGRYRCKVSFTNAGGAHTTYAWVRGAPSNGADSQTGNSVYAWGAQCEAGVGATSYIRTTSSTATRSGDAAWVPLAGFSGGPITLIAECVPLVRNSAWNTFVVCDDGTSSTNTVWVGNWTGTAGLYTTGAVTGVSQWDLSAGRGPDTVGVPQRIAVAVAANDIAQSVNGGWPSTDSVAAVPAIARMWLGVFTNGGNRCNGFVTRVTIYPTRLPNAQLATASQLTDPTTIAAADALDTGWRYVNPYPGYPHTIWIPPAAVSARYLRVDIDDPGRATTAVNGQAPGDLIIGRLWASAVLQPLRNFTYPVNEEWLDTTAKQRGRRSGAVSVDPGVKYRKVSFGYETLREGDARGPFKDFLRVVGVGSQVVFVPDPGGGYDATEAVLGRRAETSPVTRANFALWSHSMVIEEDPALGA